MAAGLTLCLPGSNVAQDARDTDFIPGSSSIEENAILRRMERELGQEFTPKSTRPEQPKEEDKMARQKAAAGPPQFSVTVVTEAERRIEGRIAITQPAVELTENQNGVAVRHRIPVPEIGQIEFLDWRAVRLHRDPEGKARRIIYFPTRCRLIRRDQTQLEGEFAAFDWLEFRIQSGLTFGSYRTYFSVDPDNLNEPTQSTETPGESGTPATETQKPAPETKKAPTGPLNLTDWNEQRPEPGIPAEIVRSIVFTGPPPDDQMKPTDKKTDQMDQDSNAPPSAQPAEDPNAPAR